MTYTDDDARRDVEVVNKTGNVRVMSDLVVWLVRKELERKAAEKEEAHDTNN